MVKFCLHVGQRTNWLQIPISTPELFCAWRPGRTSSGEPWKKIVSDRTGEFECAVCLAFERVFPLKHARLMGSYFGRFLISAIQNNICTTNHRRPKLITGGPNSVGVRWDFDVRMMDFPKRQCIEIKAPPPGHVPPATSPPLPLPKK